MFSGGINENTEFLEVIVWNFFYWTNSSNIIDKYIVITFFIANNPCPCHLYTLITESYSLKFIIMSFWAPALKSPAKKQYYQKISG